MLKRLERLVKKYGIAHVAHELGYRSTTTIRNWLTAGKIPEVAKQKVKVYLEAVK